MTEKHSYVSFLTDEQIFKAIDIVFEGYKNSNNKLDFKAFNKRLVDPLHMLFLTKFGEMTEDNWVKKEITRQSDKSLSNLIGYFQEEILGQAAGFNRLKVGDSRAHSMDIVSEDHKIIADIKNKYNTVKGSDYPSLFKELENALKFFPNATAYYVCIVDTNSEDEIWSFTARGHEYRNPRIRKISADRFYAIVFGKDDAFYEFVKAMPKAVNDFIKIKNKHAENKGDYKLLEDIQEIKQKNGYNSLYEVIMNSTFKKYNHFK